MPRDRDRLGKNAACLKHAACLALTLASLFSGGCGHLPFARSSDSSPASTSDIALLTKHSSENPSEPYWPFRIAEVLEAKKQVEGAESQLRESLARDPSYEPALALLSQRLYQDKRHEDAVRLLEQARQHRSGILPVELCAALALNYEALGRKQDADALLQGALGRSVDWKENGPALVYLHLKGDRFLDSPQIARKSLEADPTSAVNLNNYGIAQLYEGDPQGAKQSFLKAHDLDPDLPGALYNLAIVDHFYFFQEESARQWYRRYRSLAPEDPDGLESALARETAPDSSARSGSAP
jgi:tetratricopeptide (TPR) repeat protein